MSGSNKTARRATRQTTQLASWQKHLVNVISFRGSVNWSPRSCDITPTDYFLWGYVKSQVYTDKPQTLNDLEANIRRVIGGIQPQLLERVFENWTSRLGFLRERNGAHMPEIIFKR